jgi:twitching motility protein PilT
MVPFDVLSIEDLELPQKLKELVLKPQGLVLITGLAGSGKSTTLAAMVNYLNQNEERNIITIEDTIEFLHSNNRSIIAQRDLQDDVESFAAALKHAERHIPDIIVIGEMRDPDTIINTIRVAETGCLVIGLLNANDTLQAIDHILELFPEDKQKQIRVQLSRVLEGVISQKLVTRINGGRVAIFEILNVDNKVKEMIRESKLIQIGNNGCMQSMDQELAKLVNSSIVSKDEAINNCRNPELFNNILNKEPKKNKTQEVIYKN